MEQEHTKTPWYTDGYKIDAKNAGHVNGICEMLHTSDEDVNNQVRADAAHIVRCVNSYDALLELAAEALWKRDYPNGGSIYKTYESLNFEDKELYRNEAIARARDKTMEQDKRYKAGKKAGQLRPVKTAKPRLYAREENYILSCIDGEGYGVTLKTDSKKLQFLFDTFKSEYGWSIERYGAFKALQEWLMGLPSCCTIAFYNHDILELAREWGRLPVNATEKQEYEILEHYWAFMAMRILGLWNKYKIQ